MQSETESRTGYRYLMTQKDYLKVIAANIINRFGDSIDSIAFTWLVYALTGNAVWSAVIFGVNQLPTILLQPFLGALVERWNKKRLMVLTDVFRGIVVVGFVILYLMELLNPWIMLLFTLTISTVEAFRVPAGMALVPKILERRLYEFGTGLNSTLSTVMQMAGLAAAGIIIGSFGIKTAILVDAVTYFLSAGILMLIRYREKPEEAMAQGVGKDAAEGAGEGQEAEGIKDRKAAGASDYIVSLKEGLAYIRERRIILNFCILAFLLNGLIVPVNAFQAPLISEVLGMGSEFLSLINLVILAGMGAASFLYPYIHKRVNGTRVVLISGVTFGICYLVYPLSGLLREHTLAVTLICSVSSGIYGVAVGLISSVLGVEFMKAVKEDYMARCGSVFNAMASAAVPVMSALSSLLAVFLDVSVIFIACGILVVVLFTGMALARIKFDAPEEV